MARTKEERFRRIARALAGDFDAETCEADETVCAKCLRDISRTWTRTERGQLARVYACHRDCSPTEAVGVSTGMECDGCGVLMPSRGRLPTTRGLMCLHCWAAAYDGATEEYGEVIYDLAMCPRCGESAVSPAWAGHCSDYCRDAALEDSASELADRLDGAHAEGGW